MNELESTRAKLKCLEMVAGTDLKWWEVVRSPDEHNVYQKSNKCAVWCVQVITLEKRAK